MNPFENEEGLFHVLINSEGQHSLWPVFIAVPEGWKIGVNSAERSDCLAFIANAWTDMRPITLRDRMAKSE